MVAMVFCGRFAQTNIMCFGRCIVSLTYFSLVSIKVHRLWHLQLPTLPSIPCLLRGMENFLLVVGLGVGCASISAYRLMCTWLDYHPFC